MEINKSFVCRRRSSGRSLNKLVVDWRLVCLRCAYDLLCASVCLLTLSCIVVFVARTLVYNVILTAASIAKRLCVNLPREKKRIANCEINLILLAVPQTRKRPVEAII